MMPASSEAGPRFSLMFFSASEESLEARKYRLVLEAARFADERGFEALWVPERHFATLGGLYPNPAVLHAALAVTTRRLHLRAGSVVLPLHDPLRVAEEWSVVDNLSGGRVGVSLASGWNPHDFVLAPQRYATRHDELFAGVPMLQALWRGESVRRVDGAGRAVDVRILPRPVQAELPLWATAARSPQTFARAGRSGLHLLSHLLDQEIDELAAKVRLYRQGRAEAGLDPRAGRVTIMLHTFVGADETATREAARAPYCAFLRSNVELIKGLAHARGEAVDFEAIAPAEQDAFVNFLYDRFAGSRALIGTPSTCLGLVERLYAAGVDELACLLDFGPTYDDVLMHLPWLDELRGLAGERAHADGWTRDQAQAPAPAAAVGAARHEGELPVEIAARCGTAAEPQPLVQALRRAGFESRLEHIERVSRGANEALLRLRAGAVADDETHLEAAWVSALAAVPAAGSELAPLVPLSLGALEFGPGEGAPVWSHARVHAAADTWVAHVRLLAEDGRPRATLRGLVLAPLPEAESVAEPAANDWYYELSWEPRAATAPQAVALPRAWLLLSDATGVGRALADGLRQGGATVTCLARDEVFDAANATRLDASALSRLRNALAAAPRDAEGRLACVHLWSLDVPDVEAEQQAGLEAGESWGVGALLVLLQALVERGVPARTWVVTRGAQPVVTGEPLTGLAQTPVWGLGRTAAMEHPEVWGGLIDLDSEPAAAQASAQLLETLRSPAEDQSAWRGGQLYTARLQRLRAPAGGPLSVRHDATYLVTGGLWGLGLQVARWLVQRGARHVALPGRTPLPPREAWAQAPVESEVGQRVAAVRALEQSGARVYHEPVDVADEGALAGWLRGLSDAGAPAVRGVVHAASVWRDAEGQSLIRTLAQLDLAALRQVLRPKVTGSLALHRALAGHELDFMVFFSSAASLTGSAGQGNYAAASTFMDALAHHRRRLGLPAVSVNWGPVSGAGFGATEEGLKVHRYWESNGLGRLSPPELLAALERTAAGGHAQVGVMKVDWARLADCFPGLRQAPWAAQLVRVAAAAAPAEMRARLAAARAEERRELLLGYVQDEVAAVMRLERRPDPRRRLFDMGMDSLMALELKTRMQNSLGAEVPVTAVFNHATSEALTDFLLRDVVRLDGSAAEEPRSGRSALDRVQALSDAEAERLLAERLSGREVAP